MKRGFDGIQGPARPGPQSPWRSYMCRTKRGALTGTPGHSPYPFIDRIPLEAGVDLFFVISGFVMVWSSWDAFGQLRSVMPFIGRRLLRVVPLYWLLTLATIAAALAVPGALSDGLRDGWGYVGASLLFVPWRRMDGFVQPVLRLGWTLQYEMLFYAMLACVLPLLRRTALKVLLAALALLVLAGQTVPFASVPLAFWTDPIVAEFGFGVLVAIAAKRGWRAGSAGLLVFVLTASLASWIAQAPGGDVRVLVRGVPAAVLVFCALSWEDLPRWLVLLGERILRVLPGAPIPDAGAACPVRAPQPAAAALHRGHDGGLRGARNRAPSGGRAADSALGPAAACGSTCAGLGRPPKELRDLGGSAVRILAVREMPDAFEHRENPSS